MGTAKVGESFFAFARTAGARIPVRKLGGRDTEPRKSDPVAAGGGEAFDAEREGPCADRHLAPPGHGPNASASGEERMARLLRWRTWARDCRPCSRSWRPSHQG